MFIIVTSRENVVLAMLLILVCIMTHLCTVSSIYMYVYAYDHKMISFLELNHTYVSRVQSYLGGSDQGLIEPNATISTLLCVEDLAYHFGILASTVTETTRKWIKVDIWAYEIPYRMA